MLHRSTALLQLELAAVSDLAVASICSVAVWTALAANPSGRRSSNPLRRFRLLRLTLRLAPASLESSRGRSFGVRGQHPVQESLGCTPRHAVGRAMGPAAAVSGSPSGSKPAALRSWSSCPAGPVQLVAESRPHQPPLPPQCLCTLSTDNRCAARRLTRSCLALFVCLLCCVHHNIGVFAHSVYAQATVSTDIRKSTHSVDLGVQIERSRAQQSSRRPCASRTGCHSR
jgi:hypothetical protein